MGTLLAPLQEGGTATTQFSAHVYCGQMAGWIKIPLVTDVSLSPVDIVFDGDPAPPKRGTSPPFLAHVCCGQMAVCIRIPLGMEVGRNLGDNMLDGDPAPPPLKGHSPPPQFSAHVCCDQSHQTAE